MCFVFALAFKMAHMHGSSPRPSRHTCRDSKESRERMAVVAAKRKTECAPQDEPSAKVQTVLKNNLSTYFQRQASGWYVKTTPEQKCQAMAAQAQYKTMSETSRMDFVKAFQANKHSKNFQWMKEFTDTLVIKNKTTDVARHKYMTRSFAIKGYMHDALWSLGASPMKACFVPPVSDPRHPVEQPGASPMVCGLPTRYQNICGCC